MAMILNVLRTVMTLVARDPILAYAKGGFNAIMMGIGLVLTGYFSNLDKSVQALSVSVTELNQQMTTVIERGQGQQKVQELHNQKLEAMDRWLRRLEETLKENRK